MEALQAIVGYALLAASIGPGRVSLIAMIDSADAVVIAQSSPGAAGAANTLLHLMVRQTLKGALPVGDAEAYFERTDRSANVFPTSAACGIFLLVRSGNRWRVIPQWTPQLQFEDFYFPSDSCSAPSGQGAPSGASVRERVLGEYVHSVKGSAASPRCIRRLFSSVSPRDSRMVELAGRELSHSANPDLRLLGLGWRIWAGDGAAVEMVAANIDAAMRSSLGDIVALSVANYSSPDPGGARALGTILNSSYGIRLEVPLSVALRNIHTRECLPSLYRLLDSVSAFVREEAVGGFSLFLLGAAPLNDITGHTEFDKAVNPGTRKRLSADEERHIHFGSFTGAGDEAEVIQWWKGRYRRLSTQ